MNVGCFTPVRDRQLFLRSCLMQMHLQTQPSGSLVILINGPDAATYDLRCVEDLLEPWIDITRVARSMSTREASTLAIERLLESDTDLFFKIDSDDIYQRNYLRDYVSA